MPSKANALDGWFKTASNCEAVDGVAFVHNSQVLFCLQQSTREDVHILILISCVWEKFFWRYWVGTRVLALIALPS